MNKHKALDFGLPTLLLIIGTLLIAYTGADLKISAMFHDASGWPIGFRQSWWLLYKYGFYPSYIVAGFSLITLIAGYFNKSFKKYRKSAAFMALVFVIGAGLLVNTVFKDHWGRPRPRDVVEFNGKQAFNQPWELGKPGNGKSFPSGHAASAFYLAAPFFILRRSRLKLAYLLLCSGLFYGVLMGIARIAQGGHFISDILWSWGFMHLTATIFYYILRLDSDNSSRSRTL